MNREYRICRLDLDPEFPARCLSFEAVPCMTTLRIEYSASSRDAYCSRQRKKDEILIKNEANFWADFTPIFWPSQKAPRIGGNDNGCLARILTADS